MSDTEEMQAPAALAAGEPETSAKERPAPNAALIRCMQAWQRAHKKAVNNHESGYDVKAASDTAFLRAMPPLSGPGNISDFIACVTYAILIGILRGKDAAHLFGAAKIAIANLRNQPKTAERAAD